MIDSYFMALHLSQTQNHMRFLYVPAPKIAQSVPIAHVPSFENVIFVKKIMKAKNICFNET